ncbi:MAG: hypothetical protein IJ158_07250 [Treponema sp.]|nr:hypothetical protein [Treponema sp.]
MLNFITLFDKNYMSRGLVLYNSLTEHCKAGFCLYVLAMDDVVATYLSSLNYSNLKVITVAGMNSMYPVLERLEKERTRGEFSWTLSSFSIQYALKKFNLDSCTYIDSDICFYNDPQILLDELGEKSVLITEHNYTPEYDQSATSGKFCVQFMYFKNNGDGNNVLEYWRSKCEEWCYARMEDGKFGDQKYLDDWESRFEGIVYNCRNIGCGVAPWNVQKYEVTSEKETLFVTERITKIKKPIVFFHYHALAEVGERKWCLSHYRLTQAEKDLLYKPYIRKLYEAESGYPAKLVEKKYVKMRFPFYLKLRIVLGYIKRFNIKQDWRMIQKGNMESVV